MLLWAASATAPTHQNPSEGAAAGITGCLQTQGRCLWGMSFLSSVILEGAVCAHDLFVGPFVLFINWFCGFCYHCGGVLV